MIHEPHSHPHDAFAGGHPESEIDEFMSDILDELDAEKASIRRIMDRHSRTFFADGRSVQAWFHLRSAVDSLDISAHFLKRRTT